MAWLAGYKYRKQIAIDGSTAGEQTNYQMKLAVHRAIGTDSEDDVFIKENCRDDFNDIRFTKLDGSSELDHWREAVELAEWSPYASNPIISPEGTEDLIFITSVFKDGATHHMFYTYNDAADARVIGHATSNDGKSWTKDSVNNPILEKGAAGKFDENGIAAAVVWKEGTGSGCWRMLYTGLDNNGYKAIGYAIADSPEGSWTRQNDGNAVLAGGASEWDENDVETTGVIKVGSTYYCWYSKVAATRQIGVATSTNLTSWTKDENNPLFDNGRFMANPFKYGDDYYLLIGHYTFESDYTEFELYQDSNPTFYGANRTFLGVIKSVSPTGWDSHDEDVPYPLTDDINRNSYSASGNELWIYYSGEAADIWKGGLLVESSIADALTKKGIFWIEFDSIPASPDSANFYIYYGKADASSGSNGAATFIKFDDFEDYDIGDPPSAAKGWSTEGTGASDKVDVQANPSGSGQVLRFLESGNNILTLAKLAFGSELYPVAVDYDLYLDNFAVGDHSTWYSILRDIGADEERIYVRWHCAGGVADAIEWHDGEAYQDFDPAVSFAIDTWYKLNHLVYSNDYHLVIDGADKDGGLYSALDTGVDQLKIFTTRFDPVTAYLNNVKVRNYCSPEPTWGAWGSEEEALVVVEGTAAGSGIGLATSSSLLEVLAQASAFGIGLATSAAKLDVLATASGEGIGLGTGSGYLTVFAIASGNGIGLAEAQAILDVIAQASGSGVGEATAQVVREVLANAVGSGVGLGSVSALIDVLAAAVASGEGLGTVEALLDVIASASGSGIGKGAIEALLEVLAQAQASGVGIGGATGVIVKLGTATGSGIGVGLVDNMYLIRCLSTRLVVSRLEASRLGPSKLEKERCYRID